MRSQFYFRLVLTGASFLFSSLAQAQFSGGNWGTGMYGGAGSCGYEVDVGDEATSVADDISKANDEIKELQEKLSDEKKELREKTHAIDKAKNEFERSGFKKESAVYSLVSNHIQNKKTCDQYKSIAPPCDKKDETCQPASQSPESNDPFTSGAWSKICKNGSTDLKGNELCSQSGVGGTGYKFNPSSCASALNEWQKSFREKEESQSKVTAINNEIKERKTAISGMKKDYKKAVREYAKEQKESSTEGGCYECMLSGNGAVYKPYKSSALEIGGEVALGLGAMYMGSQLYKSTSANNASLGFPTAPVSTFGFGYPYFMGALYGAVGGGGMAGGSFGCGSSASGGGFGAGPYGMMGPWGMQGMYGANGQMGGPFGYPASMYASPMGGGMFNAGMGPWGMNGPWGLGGGGMGGGMGGMMSPYGGMGGMGGMGMGGNMQMQMQQMQMQMQQAQSYMQYQQRQQQNYMASQQVMSNLYSQLNQLMSQIQQVQLGASMGGSYTGGYYMGPYSTGTSTLPGVGTGTGTSSGATPTVR